MLMGTPAGGPLATAVQTSANAIGSAVVTAWHAVTSQGGNAR